MLIGEKTKHYKYNMKQILMHINNRKEFQMVKEKKKYVCVKSFWLEEYSENEIQEIEVGNMQISEVEIKEVKEGDIWVLENMPDKYKFSVSPLYNVEMRHKGDWIAITNELLNKNFKIIKNLEE